MEKIKVKVGQVWEDCDNRRRIVGSRQIVIERIDGNRAVVYDKKTGRNTRIRLDRFKPASTGYRLIGMSPR